MPSQSYRVQFTPFLVFPSPALPGLTYTYLCTNVSVGRDMIPQCMIDIFPCWLWVPPPWKPATTNAAYCAPRRRRNLHVHFRCHRRVHLLGLLPPRTIPPPPSPRASITLLCLFSFVSTSTKQGEARFTVLQESMIAKRSSMFLLTKKHSSKGGSADTPFSSPVRYLPPWPRTSHPPRTKKNERRRWVSLS